MQNALYLAAEIGVAGRVDDVDTGHIRAMFPHHRGTFRQNRDPALFLKVVRIHDAFFDALVVAEGPALLHNRINQGRFAVVDVRDNRDVSKVLCHFKPLSVIRAAGFVI